MDFEHSERARLFVEQVERFVRDRVVPNEETYIDQLVHSDDWRRWRIPPILEELKAEARGLGLWNLFLPDEEHGAGLDNRDYAAVAEVTGRSFLAPEVFNCSAPDTGNAEVLIQYGSPEQKKRWLEPLLAGEIRSGFSMTEPAVASSDATNMKATCEVVGDQVVINGQKWWTSGAGDPRCKFLIFMGVTDANAERHQRHSMVLVPIDTPGVQIVRMLPVFGHLGEPHGHAEIVYDDVRVPTRPCHRRTRTRLRDRAGQARTGPHPPLHARHRRGRAGARAPLPPRRRSRRLRQTAGQPGRQSRHHRQLPDGDRSGASVDPESRVGARYAWNLRRPRRHFGDQGHRPQRPAVGGRRRDPDPRRRGQLPTPSCPA